MVAAPVAYRINTGRPQQRSEGGRRLLVHRRRGRQRLGGAPCAGRRDRGRIKALPVYFPMELLLGQISGVEDRAVQRG